MLSLLRKRWLHRVTVLAVLVAVGVGIYRFTPPEPMCAFEVTDQEPVLLTADGQRLITLGDRNKIQNMLVGFVVVRSYQGPLHVWDTRNGQELFSEFKPDAHFNHGIFSRDGRYFAGELHKELAVVEDQVERLDALVILDIQEGKLRQIPLEDRQAPFGGLFFSPRGDLLVRLAAGEEKPIRIYETATGRLLRECAGDFDVSEEFDADAFLFSVAAERGLSDMEVWSWSERKSILLLKNVGPNHARSPDSRYYVAERLAGDGEQIGNFGVWDLRTGRLEAEYRSEDILVKPRTISGDGRYLAATCWDRKGQYVELRELPGAKQLATLRAHDIQALQFSPDGKVLFVDGLEDKPSRSLLEVPSLKVLWKQSGEFQGDMLFSRDACTAFLHPNGRPEVLCLDCATGKTRTALALTLDPGAVPAGFGIIAWTGATLRTTPDRRLLLVHQPPFMEWQAERFWDRWLAWVPWLTRAPFRMCDTVAVFDTDTCRERFRLDYWNTASAFLSDDGRTLVTLHGDAESGQMIRCWDVDAWKPLHWALGIPAGLGAFVVQWAWWRKRRALAKKATPG